MSLKAFVKFEDCNKKNVCNTKFLLIIFTFGETFDKIKSARAVLVVYLSLKISK